MWICEIISPTLNPLTPFYGMLGAELAKFLFCLSVLTHKKSNLKHICGDRFIQIQPCFFYHMVIHRSTLMVTILSVCRRGHDNTGVTDRVVNQLLTQLDGIDTLEG